MKNRVRLENDAVASIALTQGFETCVDVEDLPEVCKYRWCAFVGQSGKPYAVTNASVCGGVRRGTLIYLHTLLMGSEEQVDHHNGDTLCNRRFNLRTATNQQNQFNRSKATGKSSRFKGVSWNRRLGKWHSYIRLDGKRRHLGFFDEELDAARAYDTAAAELFGEFARLNLPSNLTEKVFTLILNC